MRCPACKSDKLVTEIGGLVEEFLCKKCNYRGELSIEDEELEAEA